MPKPFIYLCGPIQNCTAEEAGNWRNTAATLLAPEFQVLDPLRDKYDPNGPVGRENNASSTYAPERTAALYVDREIVMRDLMDIKKSRAVIRYFEKPSEGSAMEMAYANSFNVPVVLVTELDVNSLSPWTRWHAAKICRTVEEAVEYVRSFWLYPGEEAITFTNYYVNNPTTNPGLYNSFTTCGSNGTVFTVQTPKFANATNREDRAERPINDQ